MIASTDQGDKPMKPFDPKPPTMDTVAAVCHAMSVLHGPTGKPGVASNDANDHPLADWLFRHFRVGSDSMTSDKAYEIGNELNRQQRLIADAAEDLEVMGVQIREARETVARLLDEIRDLKDARNPVTNWEGPYGGRP